MGITATLNLLTSLGTHPDGRRHVIGPGSRDGRSVGHCIHDRFCRSSDRRGHHGDDQFRMAAIEPRLFLKRGAEGAEYALAASTGSAYNDLDKAMLSHFGMSAANGIYTMAYRAIDLATMPAASMEAAAEPRLFRLGATSLQERRIFGRQLLNRSVLISLPRVPECLC